MQDVQGRFFIQDIIAKGKTLEKGEIDYDSYTYSDTDEKDAREKFVAVMRIPNKEWIVGVTIYPEDLLEVNYEEIKKEELKSLMAEQRLGQTGFYILSALTEKRKAIIYCRKREKGMERIFFRWKILGETPLFRK